MVGSISGRFVPTATGGSCTDRLSPHPSQQRGRLETGNSNGCRGRSSESEPTQTERVTFQRMSSLFWSPSMRKHLFASAGVLACVLTSVTLNCARAEPPESMAYFEPKKPVHRMRHPRGNHAGARFRQSSQAQRKIGRICKDVAPPIMNPLASTASFGPVVFGASEHVGVLFENEKAINMWVSHVGNLHGGILFAVGRGW